MGLKTVRVYFNTGFNGIDIPDSPDVLDSASYVDYNEFYFLREDYDLPVIRIRDSYDNLKDVDYVEITDNRTDDKTYYFATPHAAAKSTTILALSLDALLTMGGAVNLNYTSGWIERGHIGTDEDVLFGNIAPEDFQPSRPLMIDQWEKLSPTSGSTGPDFHIIVSNVDLSALATSAGNVCEAVEGIVTGTTDPAVYFPKVPASTAATEFSVIDPDGTAHSFKLPNTGAYSGDNSAIISALSKLHSMGQLQLVASYSLPAEWTGYWELDSSGMTYTKLTGIHESLILVSAPYEYDNTIKNKKCFAMFRTASLMSLASGDRTTAAIYDTYKGDSVSACPFVEMWSDPSSTGKPYASFTNLSTGVSGSGILHPYARAVKGSQWNSSQLVLEGASGSAWNSINAAFQKSQIAMGYEQTLINNNQTMGSLKERMALQTEIHKNFGVNKGIEAAGIAAEGISAFSKPNPDPGAVVRTGADVVGFAVNLKADQMRNDLALNELIRQNEALLATRDLQQRQNRQALNEAGFAELKANIAAPAVSFTPEINLGLYGYNYFAYYETRLNPTDLHELDMYFQRYGYNGIHKPLTSAALQTRDYYNYVKASGINIKNRAGMRIREMGIAQLNAGVRIWHVLPDSQYYYTN